MVHVTVWQRLGVVVEKRQRRKILCDVCIVDTDCAGVCGGDAVEDECGVCGGPGAIL